MIGNRIVRGVAAVAVAASGVVALQAVTAPDASARCIGTSRPYVTDLRMGNHLDKRIAWETPAKGTCNNDGTYRTTLSAAKGWTPYIYKQNGNRWVLVGDRGTVTWKAGTHKSQIALCAVHNNTGNAWCGVGKDVVLVKPGHQWSASHSTLNHGF